MGSLGEGGQEAGGTVGVRSTQVHVSGTGESEVGD